MNWFFPIELIDVGLVAIYYFIFGTFIAKVFDALYGEFVKKDYKTQPTWKIFLGIIVHLILLGIVAFALRNVIDLIPSPFEAIIGDKRHHIKTFGGEIAIETILILFQKNLKDKLVYFSNRALGVDLE